MFLGCRRVGEQKYVVAIGSVAGSRPPISTPSTVMQIAPSIYLPDLQGDDRSGGPRGLG
jgi:hypothetical protein